MCAFWEAVSVSAKHESFLFTLEKPINVYSKPSVFLFPPHTDCFSCVAVTAYSSAHARLTCRRWWLGDTGLAWERKGESILSRALPNVSVAAIYLNSPFIGPFVCNVNLPPTSSCEMPRSSSRSFSPPSLITSKQFTARKISAPALWFWVYACVCVWLPACVWCAWGSRWFQKMDGFIYSSAHSHWATFRIQRQCRGLAALCRRIINA